MKFTVIFGADEAKAWKRYSEIIEQIRKRGWEIVNLSVDDKFRFSEKIASQSLFNEDVLYTVSDLKKVPISEIEWLSKNDLDINLLAYAKGALGAISKSLPKNANKEEFALPKIIFKLMDDLYPSNARALLDKLDEVRKTEASEFAFALLSRHLRDMYWATADNPPTYPDWRLSKLKYQAAKFDENKLEILINKFAKLDYDSKIGKDNMESLDLLLARELK